MLNLVFIRLHQMCLDPKTGASSALMQQASEYMISDSQSQNFRSSLHPSKAHPPPLQSMSLWNSKAGADWNDALAGYAEAVEAQGKPRLIDLDRSAQTSHSTACPGAACGAAADGRFLDRFYTAQLPELIAGREMPHITAEELVKVVSHLRSPNWCTMGKQSSLSVGAVLRRWTGAHRDPTYVRSVSLEPRYHGIWTPPSAIQGTCNAQVDWKLTRGKFRPRLLDYAKQHSGDVVQAASRDAFALAASGDDDAAAPIAALAKLKVRF